MGGGSPIRIITAFSGPAGYGVRGAPHHRRSSGGSGETRLVVLLLLLPLARWTERFDEGDARVM